MRDYLTIGPTPTGEDCAQVGSENYRDKARRECHAFIKQLRRIFNTEPHGAELKVKCFEHEYGSYLEVVCYYDSNNPDSVEYAFKCESQTPESWDEEARAELKIKDADDTFKQRADVDFNEVLRITTK